MPRLPSTTAVLRLAAACLALAAGAAAADPVAPAGCSAAASPACYQSFTPPRAGGALHYYASQQPGTTAPGPTRALVALHGHPRDAGKTFDAALRAVQAGGAAGDTLVIAPLFQVAPGRAGRCSSPGMPEAQAGELLWTCASWLEGGDAENAPGFGSFAALDALVDELARRWPGLRTVTIAGFSAGAQMVQHYIGFAADRTGPPAVRYVVADPGTWLYFDPVRPQPQADGTLAFAPLPAGSCPDAHRWKYGTEGLPATLGRDAAGARRHYAAAEIHYLEGELDSSDGKGTFYGILDKSCAAMAQGPYRMQRGQAYAQYDRSLLAPGKQRTVVLVPGCAHDVACVFPSPAARDALLGPAR